MQGSLKSLRIIRVVTTSLFALATIVGSSLLFGSAAMSASSSQTTHASTQSGFHAHPVTIKPITKKLGAANSVSLRMPMTSGTNKVLFPCQSDTNPEPLLCYGPGQIAQAYGVQNLSQRHITGAGSTIVIIDAYGSPTIQTDLKAFDAAWGLPDPSLKVIAPNGSGNPVMGWDGETTLDVEWAHAMAPGAAITLVLAPSSSDVDLYNVIKYAVDQNLGDVISMSFGENESCMDPNLVAADHQVLQEAASKGISVVASAGDFGSAQFTCDGSTLTTAVSFPASDPLVIAMGGTALTANATTGQYSGETAWNESGLMGVAGGGGYSVINQQPAYQSGITGNTPGRAVPDISLNSSIDGGVLIYESDPFSGQEYVSIIGGTSVAAPEFAGIVADGVQMAHHRLGFLNKGLYSLGKSGLSGAAFNDITSGNNILFSSGIAGYTVHHGWDAVTGWGTLKVASFLPLLIASVHTGDATGL